MRKDLNRFSQKITGPILTWTGPTGGLFSGPIWSANENLPESSSTAKNPHSSD